MDYCVVVVVVELSREWRGHDVFVYKYDWAQPDCINLTLSTLIEWNAYQRTDGETDQLADAPNCLFCPHQSKAPLLSTISRQPNSQHTFRPFLCFENLLSYCWLTYNIAYII